MTEPRWRGAEVDRLPLRDLIRTLLPNGNNGFVIEDIDLTVESGDPDEVLVETLDIASRRFNDGIKDPVGRLVLAEHKYGDAPLGASKHWTFGLIDALLRVADPNMGVYRGFYIIRTPKPVGGQDDPILDPNTDFNVNNVDLTRTEFCAWLRDEIQVPPYVFSRFFTDMVKRLRRYTSHVVEHRQL